MHRMRDGFVGHWGLLAVVIGCLAITAATAQAQSIGLNFVTDGAEHSGDGPLGAADTAGVPAVAQANWNSTNALTTGGGNGASDGTEADVVPSPGVLVDDTGAATGVTVSWTSSSAWALSENNFNPIDTPDDLMMTGFINDGGQPLPIETPTVITFSNLNSAYSSYDVYVYLGSDDSDALFTGREGMVSDGTTTYSYATNSNEVAFPAGYLQTTDILDDVDDFPRANYAVFSSLTTDSFTITNTGLSANTGVHGIQIVGVPVVATPGDFDSDSDVDGGDFLAWQRSLGDAASLALWEDNFGAVAAVSAASAVPEPAGALLTGFALLAIALRPGRRP